jgi:hypothetical protein
MSSTSVPLDDSMSILSASTPPKRMTDHEADEVEKADLLARFFLLKQRGTHVSKTYTVKSSLNEMRMEMGRIEHENQVAQSIKINRRMLVAGVSAFETMTENYGPKMTRGKFHRVSHFVTNSIKDYDSAFERLSDQYGGIIGSITKGDPLYEIAITLLYQLITYAVFYRGAETAKANEDLTADDIKKRFPNVLQEAVEIEMNKIYHQQPRYNQWEWQQPPSQQQTNQQVTQQQQTNQQVTQQQQTNQQVTQQQQQRPYMPQPSAKFQSYVPEWGIQELHKPPTHSSPTTADIEQGQLYDYSLDISETTRDVKEVNIIEPTKQLDQEDGGFVIEIK